MVTVPRPIKGSIGSRIRVIFGETGSEWLLLLNYDNGDTKWQVKNWNNIPNAVAKQINNCTSKGRDVTSVDFDPDGAWFVHGEKPDGTAGHAWWGGVTSASSQLKDWCGSPHTVHARFGRSLYGVETYAIIQGNNGYCLSGLHDDLRDRLKRIHNRNKTIKFVRLFDSGQYYVSDQEGTEWVIHNDNISKELKKGGHGVVNDLAIAEDGSWVVIRGEKYVSSTGVDPDLTRAISNFYLEQRRYGNERSAAIRAANETNERERLARERAAEEAREAAEREESERQARETAEREERERMEREAAEREEKERARREAEREAAAQLSAATRISSLEAALEKRLTEEAADIKDTEEKLRNRKRSFQETLQSMSSETQSRLSLGNDGRSDTNNRSTCVICHDEVAIMAVSPCGHVCLCNNCADVCMGGHTAQRKCPLCRGNMSSVLRIYLGN